MIDKRLLIAPTVAVMLCGHVYAIHQGGTEDGRLLPYARSMSHPLDEPINAALPKGSFMMNLGPTGIRGDIRPEYPKAFKVTFVFQDSHSPAKGLVKPGDMIVGAGGKDFREPHKFHRKQGGRGWPGPPFELAHAIEAAQGSDGKLTLSVLEGGSPNKRKNVTIQLKPVGKFAPTWPWNCPRSDQLREDLLDFMLDEGNIKRMKRHHYIQALLAVWASGDKRAMPLVKDAAQSYMKSKPDFRSGGMGQTWMTGYKGILLGEYYNATKDNGVKAAAAAYAPFYEYAQFENGSYGHRSAISFIATGKKPYASMAAAGGICMLAQSLFRANGLAYSELAYQRAHLGHLRSAGRDGGAGIAYGFAGIREAERPTDHAVLELESTSGIKEPKPRPWWPELGGKGLPIEGGLAALGKYKVVWPHKDDHRWRDGCIDWLTNNEKSKVVIKYNGKDSKTVTAWRHLPDKAVREPTSPYNTTPDGAGHQAGSAPGALAHFISNKGNKSWEYLGRHMANGCALSPKMLWDGHADAVIHSFFGALAAFRADEKNLRSWLDYTKTWIILSETHEPRAKGGLVDQPFGCQRNATCSIACGRTAYTHVAIAILSVPKRHLLITGADYAQPAAPTTAKAHSYSGSSYSGSASAAVSTPTPAPVAARPALRDARSLPSEGRDALEKVLKASLAALSDKGLLSKEAIRVSFTQKPVYVIRAESSGTLTFQLADSTQSARVRWKNLSPMDIATIAVMLAEMRPDSGDLQAVAAVCLESIGSVAAADEYFDKAGSRSKAKLEKLFN